MEFGGRGVEDEHMYDLRNGPAVSCAACRVGSHKCTPVEFAAVPRPALKYTTMALYADLNSTSAVCKLELPPGQAKENWRKRSPKSTADMVSLPLESLPSPKPENRTALVTARLNALYTEPSLTANAEASMPKKASILFSSTLYLLKSSRASVLGL